MEWDYSVLRRQNKNKELEKKVKMGHNIRTKRRANAEQFKHLTVNWN